MKKHGTIVHPKHFIEEDFSQLPQIDLSPAITMFYHKTPTWHRKHKIDEHFLCEG